MGHWDEHLAVQTFLNDLVLNSEHTWFNHDIAAFLLGVAQHELYDLMVDERPIAIQRIDFHNMQSFKTEMPAVYLNLIGIGVGLWKTFKHYSQNHDKGELRLRLLGLLGAVTPDILEGIRLAMMPDAVAAWKSGDAQTFHLSPKGWTPIVDTRQNPEKDLQRRALIQGLTVSLELFNISF